MRPPFSRNLPRLNFSFVNWKFVVTVALVIFYIGLFARTISSGGLNSIIGDDFVGYWSVGKIANEQGYSKIYDLPALRQVQQGELIRLGYLGGNGATEYSPVPVAYLPVFILPLQVFARLPLQSSYWLWNGLNLLALIGYLAFFLHQAGSAEGTSYNNLRLLILSVFSYATISNLFSGQINVLLVISMGEVLRAALRGKPFLSGLWLGVLLIKPQLLILLIPFFIVCKEWKVLRGFILSSAGILLGSWLLSGPLGLRALVELLLGYTAGLPTNEPIIMANWRMLGLVINQAFNTNIGWLLVLIGSLLTLIWAFRLMRLRPPFGSPTWVTTLLGLSAASLALSWHTHFYMTMVLIPLLLFVVQKHAFPEGLYYVWVGLIPPVWLCALTLEKINPTILTLFPKFPQTLIAIAGLLMNLFLLIYCVKKAGREDQANKLCHLTEIIENVHGE